MLRHKNFSGTSTTTSCYYIYNVIWCYIIRASLVLLLQLQAPSFIYIIYIYTYIIVYIYIYITCCYVIRTSLVLLQQLHAKLCIYIHAYYLMLRHKNFLCTSTTTTTSRYSLWTSLGQLCHKVRNRKVWDVELGPKKVAKSCEGCKNTLGLETLTALLVFFCDDNFQSNP